MNKKITIAILLSIILTMSFQKTFTMTLESPKRIEYKKDVYIRINEGIDKNVYKSTDKTKVLLKYKNKNKVGLASFLNEDDIAQEVGL